MESGFFRARVVGISAVVIVSLSSCVGVPKELIGSTIEQENFEALLDTLARGWNTNDAALAVSVFTDDAVYAEPPAKQFYSGRDQIFEFFGGTNGRSTWMNMRWHNLSFNREQQVGAGEFTFSWEGGQVHGVVSIKVEGGLISRWREYFYASDLKWDDFQKPSEF